MIRPPRLPRPPDRNDARSGYSRGRIQYVDVVLGFATLVTFIVVAPWVYGAISMATGVLPPLSATLLRLSISMFVIAMIISVGVSAQSS